MAQTEQLNIKVTEDGSSNVAKLLRAIAKEARTANAAVKELRKIVGGKGTVAEAKGAGGKSTAARDHASAVKRSQASIRKAMKATADQHSVLHKQSVARSKAMESRVNAQLAKQASAENAAHKSARSSMNTTWTRRRKIFMDRRKLALAAQKLEAKATLGKKKVFRTTTDKFVVGRLKQEAAAHKVAGAAARHHGRSLMLLRKHSDKAAHSVRGLANQVYFAQRAFATLGGALVLRAYFTMSDQFQNLSNRIRLVTNSTEAFNATQKRLFKIAKDTRQSVVSTTETFIRLRKATESQHVPVDKLFDSMSTINKMLALSGRGAVEAEQAMRQLSQAFSKGKLDGDEFRTVSEAMPSVLTALEKSLGKTRGELRKMSEEGKISTKALLTAFEGVADQVDKDFAGSTKTLSQSSQLLKDEILKVIAAFNEESGALKIIQGAMGLLANNLGLVVKALKLLFYWMAAKAVRATIMWASSLRLRLMPALIQGIINTNLLTKAIGIQSTLVLGGAAAFATMAVAVGAALVISTKIGSWVDETETWQSVTDTLFNMDTVGTAPLDFIDKYTDKIKELHKEQARNREHGVGGRGGSTDREIKKLQIQIDLQKSFLASQIAAEKAKFDAEAEAAVIALTTEEYKKLHKELNAAGPDAKKYSKDMQLIRDAHDLGIIGIKEMIRQLNFLEQAFSAADTSVTTVAIKTFDERTTMLAKATKKFEERFAATGSKKKARAAARDDMDLAKRTLKIFNELVKTKSKFASIEVAESFAIREIDLAQREAAFKKLTDEPTKDRKKKEKDLSGDAKKALDALLASINPVIAATQELDEAQAVLEEAQVWKHLSQDGEEAAAILEKVTNLLRDQKDPLDALERALVKEATTMGMTTDAVAKYNEQLELRAELMRQLGMAGEATTPGVEDAAARAEGMRVQIASSRELADAIQSEIDAIVTRNDAQQKYFSTLQAINRVDDIEEAQRRELHLKNLTTLYPLVAKEIRELAEGTIHLSKEEKGLVKVAKEERAKLLQLNQAREAGVISIEGYLIAVKKIREETRLQNQELNAQIGYLKGIKMQVTDTAIYEAQTAAITNMYGSIEDVAVGTIDNMSTLFDDFLAGAEDPWKNFATSMKDTFRTMVDTILEDLTRLMIKMALAAAFKQSLNSGADLGSIPDVGGGALGGAAGGAVSGGAAQFLSTQGLNPALLGGMRHGGSFVVKRDLPHFANGGAMKVGGTGGPDTKLVQFMASPGENVFVTNPGQTRMDEKRQAPAAPQIQINNIVDPKEMAAALASPAGRKAILNVIQQDGQSIKRLLG